MAVSVAPRAWLQGGSLSSWLRAAARYLPIAIVVLVWQLVVEFDLVDRAFLPSFGETVRALWEMTRNGEIVVNLLVSLYRALGGLVDRFDRRRGDRARDGDLAPRRPVLRAAGGDDLFAAQDIAGAVVHSLVRDRQRHQHAVGRARLSSARDREHLSRRARRCRR